MKVNMSMTRTEKKITKGILVLMIILGFIGLLLEPYGTLKERLISAGINALCLGVIFGGAYLVDWILSQPTREKNNSKSRIK